MKLNDYQTAALAFAATGGTPLAVRALGLAGETGEVVDEIKKHIGHGHDLNVSKLRYELGDVLWYVAGLAQALGLTLEDVAAGNLEKLRARYPEGHFTRERSVNRQPEMCGCDMMDRCAKHAGPTFHTANAPSVFKAGS